MTDNAIIRRDGASAGNVQESDATISDSGTINIPAAATYDINGAPHTHAGLSTYDSDVIMQDITTNNADSDNHGFLPKLSGDSDTYLDGAGTWGTPSGGGGGLFASYAVISDHKANNTAGGTFTSGAWRTRDLNTEDFDGDGIVTIASNQFTPTSASYLLLAWAPARKVGQNKLRLYNATQTSVEFYGSNSLSAAADATDTHAFLVGRFTANGTDAFEIQHYSVSTQATNGFGAEQNFGVDEIYTQVLLIQEA